MTTPPTPRPPMHPQFAAGLVGVIRKMFSDVAEDGRKVDWTGPGNLSMPEWAAFTGAALIAGIEGKSAQFNMGLSVITATKGDILASLTMLTGIAADAGWAVQPPVTLDLDTDRTGDGMRAVVVGWVRQEIAATAAGDLDGTMVAAQAAMSQFVDEAPVARSRAAVICLLAVLTDVLATRYMQAVEMARREA